ncbi:MAG: DUF4365 domain-containing protein [Planctomycetes bacterium]|nr:DUF4365 domain-containing protein [Planctomycetota bacterium]
MSLLPPNEIESELSYAYLHAVASSAGMSCSVVGSRHDDKQGIDGQIRALGRLSEKAKLTDISLNVQLKATTNQPNRVNGKIPYFIKDVKRYQKLRKPTVNPPRILIVLFLPGIQENWLEWTPEKLSIRDCAWWVSLRGAPETENNSGTTVYLPEEQYFNPDGLSKIMRRLSENEEITYEQ